MIQKNKWHIAEVVILFAKLKDNVKTESGRRMVYPGEWFMPLVDDPKGKWMSFSAPKRLARLATDEEVASRFGPSAK